MTEWYIKCDGTSRCGCTYIVMGNTGMNSVRETSLRIYVCDDAVELAVHAHWLLSIDA